MPTDAPKDRRYALILGLALVCLALDQASKAAVTAFLPLNHGFAVIPGFFDIVHVQNRGAAFGFLNRSDIDWQVWLFGGAVALACAIIFHLVRQSEPNRPLFWGFGLILGGAVGNLVDRVRLRAVTDFLDVYVGSWHWPAFNVADIAICAGAALVALTLWPSGRKTRS